MTNQMKSNTEVVETIIDMLKHIDVDAVTMLHIIEQVGMRDKITMHSIFRSSEDDIKYYQSLKNDLPK